MEGATVTAAEAARALGVQVAFDGGDLTLEAVVPPPAEIVDQLAGHKTAIVALLRPGRDGWSGEDWVAFFDERAGIAEFDGGLPRIKAEACAFACCIAEWLNRNPARSPPGRCLACGDSNHPHDPLLPYGDEPTGHAWLHGRCWPAWYAGREAEAAVALAAMGLPQREMNGSNDQPAPGEPWHHTRRERETIE